MIKIIKKYRNFIATAIAIAVAATYLIWHIIDILQ